MNISSEAWLAVQAVAASLSVVAAGVAVRSSLKIHRESGPLINVKLNSLGFHPEDGGHISIEDGKFELPPTHYIQIELAKFTIQNSGRTPATIKGFYFNIGGTKKGRLLKTPALYEHLPNGTNKPFIDGQLTIEPFGERILFADFWPLVRSSFKEDQELQQIRLLAEVQVAGVRKHVTSKKSTSWKIKRNCVTMVEKYDKVTPRDILASELARCFQDLRASATMTNELWWASTLSGPDYKFEDMHSFMQPLYRSPRGVMAQEGASADLMTALLRASATMHELGSAVQRSKAPAKDMLSDVERIHDEFEIPTKE